MRLSPLPVIATAALIAAPHTIVAQQHVELRVPAFTAYLLPDPDAARMSQNRPVLPFGAKGSSIAWYAHLDARVTLDPTILVKLPKGEQRELRLTIARTTGGTAIMTRTARVEGTGAESRVAIGPIAFVDTGYFRFELSTTDGAPAPTLEVQAMLIDSASAPKMHFNLDPRRNAASVHLRYPTDSTLTVTGFYNEVTAVDDPVTTYYMATGFARGYFGMQVNSPTERRIIFSVWDAANGTNAKDRTTVAPENFTQLIAKGDGVVAEVFGNEGTGGHSHLVYNWKTGSTQKFFVTAKPDGESTIYSGYWYHPDKQAWQLIASFRAPKDGLGLRRLYSFSENFGGTTGHLRRKALFGNQWIRLSDGRWQELTTATFSHDPTGKENRLDRFMGVENGKFFLSHGGFVPGFTLMGTPFTRTGGGKPPVIDLPK